MYYIIYNVNAVSSIVFVLIRTCFNGRIKLRVIFIKRLHCPESAVIWRKTLSNNYAILLCYTIYTTISNTFNMCRGGAMVECRPCNPKVRGSNLGTDQNFEKVSCDTSELKNDSPTIVYLKRT